jgi:hypothetical protein
MPGTSAVISRASRSSNSKGSRVGVAVRASSTEMGKPRCGKGKEDNGHRLRGASRFFPQKNRRLEGTDPHADPGGRQGTESMEIPPAGVRPHSFRPAIAQDY